MRFVEPQAKHIDEVMTWFQGEPDLRSWAGPNFNYPFTRESFTQDLKLETLDSLCMISSEETPQLLAFGFWSML